MKKALKLLFVITSLMTGEIVSAAETCPYVSLSGGAAFLLDSNASASGVDQGVYSYDTGTQVSGAAGIKGEWYRLEAEAAFQSNEIDSLYRILNKETISEKNSSLSIFSLLLNGYLDFPIENSSLQPFLTAGVGYASVSLDDEFAGIDQNKSAFAYQFGAGVGIELSECWNMDVKYRYFNSSDLSYETPCGCDYSIDIASHSVSVGLIRIF